MTDEEQRRRWDEQKPYRVFYIVSESGCLVNKIDFRTLDEANPERLRALTYEQAKAEGVVT